MATRLDVHTTGDTPTITTEDALATARNWTYVFVLWPEWNTGGDPTVTRPFPEGEIEVQFGALRTTLRNLGSTVEKVADKKNTWAVTGPDGHRARLELAVTH